MTAENKIYLNDKILKEILKFFWTQTGQGKQRRHKSDNYLEQFDEGLHCLPFRTVFKLEDLLGYVFWIHGIIIHQRNMKKGMYLL